MDSGGEELGYEEVYRERLDETKGMITLATLLDSLNQDVEGMRYDSVMQGAYRVAKRANPNGIPSAVPDATLVASVIRSNAKLMIYNIIEYSVTSLLQAVYDRIEDEGCSYADVSEKLQLLWHRAQLHDKLNNPSANNETAERLSKRLLDFVVTKAVVQIDARDTIPGGNLDADKILRLFDRHGISVHDDVANCRTDKIREELKDVKDRRNDLAHGSISFAEAGNQVTTSELAELISHVDGFLTQLHNDVQSYLESGEYRNDPAERENR